jgi:endonuclease/exonuclease/phosphatase family metal-dependent hydrolase
MKLVTWNTQWCCGLDGVISPQRIVEGARQLADFDVLCLQEIAVNYPGLHGHPGDQPALLRQVLPGFEVLFGAAVDEWSADGQRRQFGNVIATRLPLAQVEHHPLPYPADAGVSSMPRMCTVVTVRDSDLGAVRVMTTHLEYYSKPQRMAQARALRELHMQACAHAAAPPRSLADGTPFQAKVHTPNAILCGDFNLQPHEPEYEVVQQPFANGRLWDSWRLVHDEASHVPTFRVHDQQYGKDPIACDFVFVSDGLKEHVKRLEIDSATRASDHQPIAIDVSLRT